ncbi:amino acid ABC transporter permease, partial [Streptomyces sp. NPDC046821]
MSVDIDKTDGPEDTSPPPARPEAIKAIPVRHFGRYVAAVVAIGVLVAIVYA